MCYHTLNVLVITVKRRPILKLVKHVQCKRNMNLMKKICVPYSRKINCCISQPHKACHYFLQYQRRLCLTYIVSCFLHTAVRSSSFTYLCKQIILIFLHKQKCGFHIFTVIFFLFHTKKSYFTVTCYYALLNIDFNQPLSKYNFKGYKLGF